MFLICTLTVLFIYFIYIKLTIGICKSSTCLLGKTALVTGANSGLGYQTSLNLASRGCKVILADVADLQRSKDNIIKYTNNSKIVTKYLDLSSLRSVRKFAEEIKNEEEKIDILINNAGIGLSGDKWTKDGLHPVMQINYFGHFLLTHLLIDLLKKAAPSRIIFTSSCLAFLNNVTPKNLNFEEETGNSFEKLQSYCNSKFALLVASDLFAQKLENTGVTSNSLHPGFVYSDIWKTSYSYSNYFLNLFMRLYNLVYSKSIWEGSQTIVYLAVSRKIENVSGKYFFDCKPFFKPWAAKNKKLCQEIWKASEKYVQLKETETL